MKKSDFKVSYSANALRIITQMSLSLNDDYGCLNDDIDPITCSCNFHNVPLEVMQEIHVWCVLQKCDVSYRKDLVSHYDSNRRYTEMSIKNTNGKGIGSLYSNSY